MCSCGRDSATHLCLCVEWLTPRDQEKLVNTLLMFVSEALPGSCYRPRGHVKPKRRVPITLGNNDKTQRWPQRLSETPLWVSNNLGSVAWQRIKDDTEKTDTLHTDYPWWLAGFEQRWCVCVCVCVCVCACLSVWGACVYLSVMVWPYDKLMHHFTLCNQVQYQLDWNEQNGWSRRL